MKLVAYVRVSTEKLQNPERQRDVLAAVARSRGHEVVAWVVDEGTSGGVPSMERVHVQQAIKAAKAHGADGLLVESVDRWTRAGVHDFCASSAALELRHGLKLVLADVPPGMDGMALEIYTAIMAIVAKAFRERLREQIKTGLARARKEGFKNGAPGPKPKENLSPSEVAYVREQRGLGRQGAGWGRMALEITRRRGAAEVVDPKSRQRKTVTPTWLAAEWRRVSEGAATRRWHARPVANHGPNTVGGHGQPEAAAVAIEVDAGGRTA